MEAELIKISIITTLIDAAQCHMWRHMEKLPQRPAIIDSLQRCTQLGTFTNKGRPINISHAHRAGDRERGRGGGPTEGEEEEEEVKI